MISEKEEYERGDKIIEEIYWLKDWNQTRCLLIDLDDLTFKRYDDLDFEIKKRIAEKLNNNGKTTIFDYGIKQLLYKQMSDCDAIARVTDKIVWMHTDSRGAAKLSKKQRTDFTQRITQFPGYALHEARTREFEL